MQTKTRALALTSLSILSIILLFTLVDFFLHSLSADYAVPDRYFRNKIIFGTIYGMAIFWLVRKQGLFMRSLLFSGVLAASLQTRYFLEGYPLDFVLLFLLLHFLILLPVSWVFFRLMEKRKIGFS